MKKILFLICLLPCFYVNSSAQIYVVGYEESIPDSLENYTSIAKLWKNGIPYNLSDDTSRMSATDIFVSDTNVYVVGAEHKAKHYYIFPYFGKLWINGVMQNLTDTQWSEAYSIVVDNGDTYITGYTREYTLRSRMIAAFWKNGVVQPLEVDTTTSHSLARSVFVEGNDVYVTVRRRYWQNPQSATSHDIGIVWKNGEELFSVGGALTQSSSFQDMYVVNDDVYVVGYEQPEVFTPTMRATVWKNGVPQYLTEYSSTGFPQANAIDIKDNDIYVAGRAYFNDETGMIAVVWKNGELLPTYYNAGYVETGKAIDIAVVNNDIYVLTTQNNSAFVWKNEELIYELPHNLPNIYATAMFVNPDNLPDIAIPQQPAYVQKLKLYPNPAHSYITVELPNKATTADLQLFDLQGRQLKQETITTKSTVNISGLQAGIYFYRVVAGKQRYNGKLLITR
jgi:hypothetical protein